MHKYVISAAESGEITSRTLSSTLKPGAFTGQVSDPSQLEPDLMALAATYGRADILQLVLGKLSKTHMDPEELYDLCYSLHQACKLNNGHMVELLLKAEAPPFEKGESGFTAMHHAAYSGSLEVSTSADSIYNTAMRDEEVLSFTRSFHCTTLIGIA